MYIATIRLYSSDPQTPEQDCSPLNNTTHVINICYLYYQSYDTYREHIVYIIYIPITTCIIILCKKVLLQLKNKIQYSTFYRLKSSLF